MAMCSTSLLNRPSLLSSFEMEWEQNTASGQVLNHSYIVDMHRQKSICEYFRTRKMTIWISINWPKESWFLGLSPVFSSNLSPDLGSRESVSSLFSFFYLAKWPNWVFDYKSSRYRSRTVEEPHKPRSEAWKRRKPWPPSILSQSLRTAVLRTIDLMTLEDLTLLCAHPETIPCSNNSLFIFLSE